MIKNQSGQTVSAVLIEPNGDAITSGTVTVYVTIDGGTQAAGGGSVEHEGNGQWTYFPTQAETNGDQIGFLFTHASGVPVNVNVYTVPYTIEAQPTTQPIASSVTGLTRFVIREEVRRIIGDPDYSWKDINRAINSAISYINQIGRFKFHQTALDITLVEDQINYNLTGIIAEELVVFKPNTTDQKIITKVPDLITPYSDDWFTESDDTPVHYLVWGNQIYLEPYPDSVAAGETLRVFGFFRIPLFTDDVTAMTLHEQYCFTVIAWQAAAQISPTLIVESSGKQKSIRDIANENLRTMMQTELYDPLVSHNILVDYPRWGSMQNMGYISRVRG